MTVERTAGICFCLIITSAIATGQQQSGAGTQPQQQLGTRAGELTYWWAGDVAPRRRVQTRSESAGRDVVVETVEGLNIDGRLAALEEVVTETTRTVPNTEQTRQDVFRVTVDGRRQLSETTESRQDTTPGGDTSVRTTWTADLNGGVRLT